MIALMMLAAVCYIAIFVLGIKGTMVAFCLLWFLATSSCSNNGPLFPNRCRHCPQHCTQDAGEQETSKHQTFRIDPEEADADFAPHLPQQAYEEPPLIREDGVEILSHERGW